jgi:hypothetical protein
MGSLDDPIWTGSAADSGVDACPCRRAGFHFAGTCVSAAKSGPGHCGARWLTLPNADIPAPAMTTCSAVCGAVLVSMVARPSKCQSSSKPSHALVSCPCTPGSVRIVVTIRTRCADCTACRNEIMSFARGFQWLGMANHPGLMARSARAELTDRPLDWPDFPRSASRNSRPRNSRKRILFGVRDRKRRNVAFWSIDTPISVHGLSDAVPLSPEGHGSLAGRATVRLNLEPQDVVEPREGHLHAARLVQQHRFDGGPLIITDW